MLACQMSQSEVGMARIEAMCVLIFQFFYIFYNRFYCCFIQILIFFAFERGALCMNIYDFVQPLGGSSVGQDRRGYVHSRGIRVF